MDVFVDVGSSIQKYRGISKMRIDNKHNLRLFSKRGFWNKQIVFHPAGEWLAVGPAWGGFFEHAPVMKPDSELPKANLELADDEGLIYGGSGFEFSPKPDTPFGDKNDSGSFQRH